MGSRRRLRGPEVPGRNIDDRFHQFVDQAPDWAWEVDRDGVFTYVSSRVRDLLGYEPEEVVGRTPFDLMPAGEAERLRGEFQRLSRVGEPFSGLRSTHLRKDGGEVVLETNGVPVHDDDGSLVGFRGFDRDVTDQARTERDLRESRSMFQKVLDAIPVRVFWKDRDLDYLGCNRAFARDAGMESPEDLIGKDDFTMSWKEQAELYRGDDRSVIDSGEHKINYEEPQTWPDGTRLWLRTSKIPLKDAEGRIIGVLGCYENVTERKETELALRRYEQIVSSTTDLIAFVDREFRYRAANRAYADLLDATPEEMVGRTVEEMLGRELWEAVVRNRLEICLRGEDVAVQRWVSVRKLGKRFLDVRYSPFRTDDGEVAGVVINIRDSTDQRLAEEERQRLESRILHAQKLESLGVLAGGIAHDFNNLLTGILGNAGMAVRQLSATSPAGPYLEDVEKSALRAADLCRQMLAYSGKGRFLVQPLDLSAVVEEMTRLLKVSVSKTATMQCRLARDLPSVEADPAQVRQVVMNLVTNASDAIGDSNGVITIATGAMDCDRAYLEQSYLDDELRVGRYVFAEITDTGCGMDPTTLGRLFDPFFTTKFTGRGLGMAAVLGILRGHRGAIKVVSEPGHGTSIKVLFPASTRSAESLSTVPTTDRAWTGSGTVLVVDDEEAVRTLARRVLESAGFAVILASQGREALDLFRLHGEEIVAVVLDLTMPEMGGEETLVELRRMRPDVPVLLSSGYNEQEVTNRFAGKGLAAFVQKPYRPEGLLGKLREVLES